MVLAMLLLGISIIILGLLLLLAPKKVKRANEILNKTIFDGEAVFAQRVLLSIICIGVGVLLVLTYISYAWI